MTPGGPADARRPTPPEELPAYAPDGLIGVAVPQANPVVEPELRMLLPPRVGLLATRLVSTAAVPADRLRDYAAGLASAVASFDTAPVAAVGFACTAASYVSDPEPAPARVVTATGAVGEALAALGLRRIALVTPYPPDLDAAAARYWQDRGVDVVARWRVPVAGPDTRAIYTQPGRAAMAAVADLAGAGELAAADAVLVSGTGLPSLAAVAAAGAPTGRAPVRAGGVPVPVLSPNLCLAWALLRRLGRPPPAGPESPLLGGWAARLAAAADGTGGPGGAGWT